MTSKDPLGDALGLNQVVKRNETPIELKPVNPNEQTDPDSDLGVARDNLHNLLTKGKSVFDELSTIAVASEQAKDFTALAQVMKALLEANRDLVALSQQRKTGQVQGSVETSSTKPAQVTNNLVVTTAELGDVLAKLKGGNGIG